MSYILRTIELSKQYKHATVADKVSIHLKKGDIYGFIGQNGAGKTTVIRIILNLIRSSGGSVELFGERVNDKNIYRHLRKIGAIIETPGFYLNLTAKENLDIHRIMMDIRDKDSIGRVLKTVGLKDEENKKVGRYSLGMKQRLGLARALLHDPQLLILDEPTNGLDPQGMAEVRHMMTGIAEQGKTVLVSSHILSEVERIVSRVGILHKGRLLEEISKEDFIKKCKRSFWLNVNEPEKAAALIKGVAGFSEVSPEDGGISFQTEDENNGSKALALLIGNGIEVKESRIIHSSLEDYFIKITGGKNT